MAIETKHFGWPRSQKTSEQILVCVVFIFTHVNVYEHKKAPKLFKPEVAARGSGFRKCHRKLRSLTVCRTDIFQLDARKGQARYLKARGGGEAVVTTEIWQCHCHYKCIITPVLGVLEQILEVNKELCRTT